MRSVTNLSLVEEMDERIVRTVGWSFKKWRDMVMSRRSVNGESNVSGQWIQGASKLRCQYDTVKGKETCETHG